MITKFKSIINGGSERSVNAKKNIISSFGLKAISIFVSLQLVPLTIDFLNAELYGLWLTLSSIVTWAHYFDLGFGNGFRNKFAEAKAISDDILCRKYLSTTYFMLGVIFTSVYLCLLLINTYLNWSSLLNIDPAYNDILHKTFIILSGFFCLNFVVSIINTLLIACQKNAFASLLQTIGQIASLITIFVMVHSMEGSLDKLAYALAGVPCLVLIVSTFVIFTFTKYKKYKPSIKDVDLSLAKNIVGLGSKFFVITICTVVIFQLTNLILTRVCGPEAVTEYNVSYKYFNLVHMVVAIIIAPFWSAYTDAYTNKDTNWMFNTLKKLEHIVLIVAVFLIFLLIVSPLFFHFWIGDKVEIHYTVSIAIAFYVFCSTIGIIYMHLINGIGKVKLQLFTYLFFAIVSVPLLYYSCVLWGIVGILITPSIALLTQAFLMRIQLYKIIDGTAVGIWNQ